MNLVANFKIMSRIDSHSRFPGNWPDGRVVEVMISRKGAEAQRRKGGRKETSFRSAGQIL
jgi:hypothetical protein